MNKKKLIIGVSVLFVVGAYFSAPLISPEYGTTYSEKQRREGNTIVDVGRDRLWPEFHDTDRARQGSGVGIGGGTVVTTSMLDELLHGNTPQAIRWSKRSEELRHSSDLYWSDLKIEEGGKNIPYQGLTELQLKKKADEGDLIACMHLVGKYSDYLGGGVSTIFQMGHYLQKLREAKIPGVEYVWGEHENSAYRNSDEYKNLEGVYGEFKEQMEQGNFLLYKVWNTGRVNPGWESDRSHEVFSLIHAGLTQKAEAGDLQACRDLGELYFSNNSHISGWMLTMIEEREKQNLFTRIGKKLPQWIFWPRYASSPEMGKAKKREAWLRMAADAGDVHAQYLWTDVCIRFLGFWSRERWEKAIKWTDELQSKGYSPACLAVIDALSTKRGVNGKKSHIKVYNPAQDQEKVEELTSYLRQEGAIKVVEKYFFNKIWKESDKEEFSLILNLLSSWNAALILPEWSNRGFYQEQIDPALYPVLFQTLEKAAREGNPEIIFFLIGEYERGTHIKSDMEQAFKWVEYLEDYMRKKTFPRTYRAGKYSFSNDTNLELVLEIIRLRYSIDYGWNLAGNEEKIFSRLLEIAETIKEEESNFFEENYIYYLLGRAYEKGIGVPEDKEKAFEIYIKSLRMLSGTTMLLENVAEFVYSLPLNLPPGEFFDQEEEEDDEEEEE